jgi:hypothetical protein
VKTHFAAEKFRDPIWRISKLYSIRIREGKVIPFRGRPQQVQTRTLRSCNQRNSRQVSP